MADSEFDELDKAVASVLQPSTSVTPASPVMPPVEETPETVVELTPEPSTEPVVVESAPVAPTQAPRVRSSGRFMDVLPPTTFTPRTPLPAPPERAEPLNPVVETPTPTAFESPTPQAQETPAEPLATPFLSDPKVEKRPLGAFSDVPKSTESEPPAELTPEVPTLSEAAQEDMQDVGLPDELHTDLLSIEATEPSTPNGETPPVPSIVQQYKEKPNSDMQPSAAIYDTDAYHMPSSRPVKKHANWLVAVWIAAIVIVGGAIGAGFYFIILPMV